VKPRALRPGDTVRVVTPASPLTLDSIEVGVQLLKDQGYKVEIARHAFKAHGYLAGDAKTRAEDLQDAFNDPAVQAVFCSRGGYGCSHLVPLLDFDAMAASRKLLVGFSDVTVLHTALNRRGLPTLYGPMPITLGSEKEPWVYDSLFEALKGTPTIPEEAPKGKTVVGGVAEGVVTGGTLCLLTDAIGTVEPLDAKGKIVLIEDVDEDSYRIDAMLTHLVQAGALEGAAGIVVGEMTRTDERPVSSMGALPWREVVTGILAPLGLPLVIDFPFGHCKNMLSMPLGIRARFDADRGTVTYLEALCD
jgi:muramoyltetrapeptide carboxypeptidase